MAISSPITITVNGTPIVMTLIQRDGIAATYQFLNSTTRYVLKIRHSYSSKNKDGLVYINHNVEFSKFTLAVPGVSPEYADKVWYTLQRLETLSDVDLVAGLFAMSVASTNQFLKDLLQSQS